MTSLEISYALTDLASTRDLSDPESGGDHQCYKAPEPHFELHGIYDWLCYQRGILVV